MDLFGLYLPMQSITQWLNVTISTYSMVVMTSYFVLGIIGAISMRYYLRRNSFTDYGQILTSPLAPGISLIAPAFNEGKTIIDNIRSLLSLQYAKFEVIIVNDGSNDDSLEKTIKAYDLERVNFAIHERLATQQVRGIYKSKNPAYSRLTLVDKMNGGKGDAINAGINVSRYELFCCVDVDSILESDALLKLVKPFIEEENTHVIATGGVVRIANSCEIEDGRLVKVHLPKSFLPRLQALEYIRTFLMGRMAWSKLNGILIISGACGLFDKEVAIGCGGYRRDIVGEDMELTVRMRRYMRDQRRPYKLYYVPDPLCWTEAPTSLRVLARQRNRWARGLAETLWIHRRLFLNPTYGLLSLLAYTYYLFFEWMAPFVVFTGLLYSLLLGISGQIDWNFFFILLGTVYSYAVLMSMLGLVLDEVSYHQYKKPRDLIKLILVGLLEPPTFQIMIMFWSLKGNIDLWLGKKAWGKMVRSGFSSASKPVSI